MNSQLVKDSLLWGIILWLTGYLLGFILFFVVPPTLIGWVITPLGTGITLWVLFKKIKANKLSYYLTLSIVWTLIAVIFDYFFLVKLLKPVDGYYKLDVYLYYILTFLLPIISGILKRRIK